MRRENIAFALLVLVIAAIAVFLVRQRDHGQRIMATARIVEPGTDSAIIGTGQRVYREICAECHGQQAEGSDRGPPFLHPIYRPDHHSDRAFFLAVRNGVRAHHWPFGDMPAQPQVSETDVAAILDYVRALQRTNGVY